MKLTAKKSIKYLLAFFILLFASSVFSSQSECFGTTKNGRLINGVKLPGSGSNFISYGIIPELAGRTYVHSLVRDIVIDAYAHLKKELPHNVFKYAETGLENGGRFKPHKTHQNGLSIDFMVPVRDENGKSVHLPTNPLNRYGYDIEFDKTGKYQDYKIDFEALAAQIVALYKVAKAHDVDLWRVIFAPDLQQYLYATTQGSYIKANVKIPTKKSWVRHDEHFHVDFLVPCRSEK